MKRIVLGYEETICGENSECIELCELYECRCKDGFELSEDGSCRDPVTTTTEPITTTSYIETTTSTSQGFSNILNLEEIYLL